MNPSDMLLVVEYEDGTRGYINLWEAIEQKRLTVKMNPINRALVISTCGDCAENRHDIDTNFGAVEKVQS